MIAQLQIHQILRGPSKFIVLVQLLVQHGNFLIQQREFFLLCEGQKKKVKVRVDVCGGALTNENPSERCCICRSLLPRCAEKSEKWKEHWRQKPGEDTLTSSGCRKLSLLGRDRQGSWSTAKVNCRCLCPTSQGCCSPPEAFYRQTSMPPRLSVAIVARRISGGTGTSRHTPVVALRWGDTQSLITSRRFLLYV